MDDLFVLPNEYGTIQEATQVLSDVDGKQVFMRRATQDGEGIEVSDIPRELSILEISSSSFDETMSAKRVANGIFRRKEIGRTKHISSSWP